MRAGVVFIAIALAVVGCKDKSPAKTVEAEKRGSGSGSGAFGGWRRIEALATPAVDAGPSKDLERAVAIAKTNDGAWRELKYKHPPAPLSAYPQGAEAVEALHAWASAKGGLPPLPKPTELGRMTIGFHDIGTVAIESATDTAAASLEDGLYLATRLVAEGRSFLEVQVGLSMLGDVKRKRRMLALEAGGSADELVAPQPDFVRILAAEALQSRRMHDFATSPEGRKELVELVKGMPGETKDLLQGVTGRTAMSMIPTDEEAAALMVFWIAALDAAQRGEPAATTIARAKKAAENAGPAKQNATLIASMLEMFEGSFARLAEPSPY